MRWHGHVRVHERSIVTRRHLGRCDVRCCAVNAVISSEEEALASQRAAKDGGDSEQDDFSGEQGC